MTSVSHILSFTFVPKGMGNHAFSSSARPCFTYKLKAQLCLMWPQWGLCILVGAPVVNFNPVSKIPPPRTIGLTTLCDCDLCSLCDPAEFQFGAGAQKLRWTPVGASANLWALLRHSKLHTSQMQLQCIK